LASIHIGQIAWAKGHWDGSWHPRSVRQQPCGRERKSAAIGINDFSMTAATKIPVAKFRVAGL